MFLYIITSKIYDVESVVPKSGLERENRKIFSTIYFLKFNQAEKITYNNFFTPTQNNVASENQSKGVKVMKAVVPEAKEALNRFKMEAASEVGVNLKQGYNGDLTAKQAGSIGGQMVKKMIESYESNMK